jgi:hypothetical protein
VKQNTIPSLKNLTNTDYDYLPPFLDNWGLEGSRITPQQKHTKSTMQSSCQSCPSKWPPCCSGLFQLVYEKESVHYVKLIKSSRPIGRNVLRLNKLI